MTTATLHIHRLIQDSQDFGSDDDHMISRVFFDLEIDGKKYEGLYANIKQPVGSSFDTAPLEVSHPVNYKGAFNYEAFRSILEKYYRGLVGSTGTGIHIAGATNVRMRNNTFVRALTEKFEVQVAGGSW